MNSDDQVLIRSHLLSLGALIVGIGAFGLASWWYFQNEEKLARISDTGEINTIHIRSAANADLDDRGIVLRKSEQGSWFLEEPFRAKASDSRIESIATLPGRSFEHAFDRAGADLGQLELDPPQVSVRFNEEEFALGGTDPVTQYRYLSYRDRIFLLENAGYELLGSDAYAFCESRLIQYSSDIIAVQLGRFRLELGAEDAQWRWRQLDEAVPVPGQEGIAIGSLSTDNAKLEQWVENWSSAYALHARDGTQMRADNASALPLARIELSTGEEISYELVEAEEETIFHDPDNGVNYHYSTEAQRSVLNLPMAGALPDEQTDADTDAATGADPGAGPGGD